MPSIETERPFQCAHCSNNYTRKDILNQHILAMHPEVRLVIKRRSRVEDPIARRREINAESYRRRKQQKLDALKTESNDNTEEKSNNVEQHEPIVENRESAVEHANNEGRVDETANIAEQLDDIRQVDTSNSKEVFLKFIRRIKKLNNIIVKKNILRALAIKKARDNIKKYSAFKADFYRRHAVDLEIIQSLQNNIKNLEQQLTTHTDCKYIEKLAHALECVKIAEENLATAEKKVEDLTKKIELFESNRLTQIDNMQVEWAKTSKECKEQYTRKHNEHVKTLEEKKGQMGAQIYGLEKKVVELEKALCEAKTRNITLDLFEEVNFTEEKASNEEVARVKREKYFEKLAEQFLFEDNLQHRGPQPRFDLQKPEAPVKPVTLLDLLEHLYPLGNFEKATFPNTGEFGAIFRHSHYDKRFGTDAPKCCHLEQWTGLFQIAHDLKSLIGQTISKPTLEAEPPQKWLTNAQWADEKARVQERNDTVMYNWQCQEDEKYRIWNQQFDNRKLYEKKLKAFCKDKINYDKALENYQMELRRWQTPHVDKREVDRMVNKLESAHMRQEHPEIYQ
jgi:hypothetical protein